jgi:hypothetical protein
MVLAAGIGLWALWQFVRAGRAGDIKTTLTERDPPKSVRDGDLDDF